MKVAKFSTRAIAIAMMLKRMTLRMAIMTMSCRKSERMIAMMTSKRILMRTKRKTNRCRRKIIFGIFYRPHDMTELAKPGGVEQELRTFLQESIFLLLFADKLLCTIYSLFKLSRRQEFNK